MDSSVPSPDSQDLDPADLLARAFDTVRPSVGASEWVPPTPEELARLLPQYRVESLLGRGGMGAVYKCWQPQLERAIALKLLPAEFAMDQQFVARFTLEARTLAKLQHPSIVTIFDFGETSDGNLYFVMEFIDGTDLRQVLRGPGLGPEQALAVVGQLCDALQAAHRVGIVHRDIKPENVLITSDGYVKLADFGLAKARREEGAVTLTGANVVMGTPSYMAPEQLAGEAADQRSDIYALGVMFYEMLTGRRPQGFFDPPSRKVQVDVRIDGVVLKALQAEPERRYQSVVDLKGDVERIQSTPLPPVATIPQRRPRKVAKAAPPTPPPSQAGAQAAVAVIFLLLGVIVFQMMKPGAPDSRKAAVVAKPTPPRAPMPITPTPRVAAASPTSAPARPPSPPKAPSSMPNPVVVIRPPSPTATPMAKATATPAIISATPTLSTPAPLKLAGSATPASPRANPAPTRVSFNSLTEILDLIPNSSALTTQNRPNPAAMTVAAKEINKGARQLATIRVRIDNIEKTPLDVKCYVKGFIVQQHENRFSWRGTTVEVAFAAFFPESAADEISRLARGKEVYITGLFANAGCVASKIDRRQVRIWIDLAECSVGREFHPSQPPAIFGMEGPARQ